LHTIFTLGNIYFEKKIFLRLSNTSRNPVNLEIKMPAIR
jgi:hypothetical protein